MLTYGWTPDDVEMWLEEAADTLRRMRCVGMRPAECKTNWPDIVRDYWEGYDINAQVKVMPGRPKPEAISRMDEVVGWLIAIKDAKARGIVWGISCGASERRVAHTLGVSRHYVRRVYGDNIERLTRRLNGAQM